MKNILSSIESFTRSLSKAIARIFSPNDKPVPEIGTTPFEGEPNAEVD
jgi:hypothetical protein